MIYADYGYYRDIYQGNLIEEADFDRLALRASQRLDALTRYRAEAAFARMPGLLRDATCAMAEVWLQAERGNPLLPGDKAIRLEITGRHHVGYLETESTAGSNGQAAMEKALYRAAWQHLGGTGLLYRGIMGC